MTDNQRTLSGRKTEAGFEWGALRSLSRYLWPDNAFETKVRVVIALMLLALAKVANVYTPILFKDAVDALSGKESTVLILPISLLVGYGIVRVHVHLSLRLSCGWGWLGLERAAIGRKGNAVSERIAACVIEAGRRGFPPLRPRRVVAASAVA